MSRQVPIKALPDTQRNESALKRQAQIALIHTVRHVRNIRFESYANSMDWIGTADHVGKAVLRFYVGSRFKGHFAGAICGAIASQLEQRPTEPVTLRPVDLADRFNTKPATIGRILERWRRRDPPLIERDGRGRYIVSNRLRDLILSAQYQSFDTDDLAAPDTPYSLAIRTAARRAYSIEVLAGWFCISRQVMSRLCRRYRIEVGSTTEGAGPVQQKVRRNTTEGAGPVQQKVRRNTTEGARPKGPEYLPEKPNTHSCTREKGQDRTDRAGDAQRPLQEHVRGTDQTNDYLDKIYRRGKYAEGGG